MTLRSRGPAVRAEAASTDQHSALDAAIDKLESRLRRSVDRSRIHHGRHAPTSLSSAAAELPLEGLTSGEPDEDAPAGQFAPIDAEGDCPIVVREKTHQAPAMTLDQAMYEMELVGHDFYLFLEKDSMRPSVVYLRKGYDYGVIHLDVTD
jgi:hypothetical protein